MAQPSQSSKRRQSPLSIEEYERDFRRYAGDLQLVERVFYGGVASNKIRAALWPYIFGLVKHRGRFIKRSPTLTPTGNFRTNLSSKSTTTISPTNGSYQQHSTSPPSTPTVTTTTNRYTNGIHFSNGHSLSPTTNGLTSHTNGTNHTKSSGSTSSNCSSSSGSSSSSSGSSSSSSGSSSSSSSDGSIGTSTSTSGSSGSKGGSRRGKSRQTSDDDYIYIEHEENLKRWRELEGLYRSYESQWKSIMPDQEKRFSVFRERKALIERDVIRSDRSHPFYADNSSNLDNLATLLMTYMMYDFDIGYLQGMSDLAAPILYVYQGDLVKSFWIFVEVMKLFRRNFEYSQKTIHFQLNCLFRLIKLTDAKLARYLRENECSNCFFVFRCIVCQFKRELMKSNSSNNNNNNNNNSGNNINDDTINADEDDYAKVLNLWDTIWCVQRRHELLAKSKCVHIYTIANGTSGARKKPSCTPSIMMPTAKKTIITPSIRKTSSSNLITTSCSQQHLSAQQINPGAGGEFKYHQSNSNNYRHLNHNSNSTLKQHNHQLNNNNNNNNNHLNHHHHHFNHSCRRNHAQQSLSRSYQNTCNSDHLKQLITPPRATTTTKTKPIITHNFASPCGSPNGTGPLVLNCDSTSNGQAATAAIAATTSPASASPNSLYYTPKLSHHQQHQQHLLTNSGGSGGLQNGHVHQQSSLNGSSYSNGSSMQQFQLTVSETHPNQQQQQYGLRNPRRLHSLTSLSSNISCGSSPGSPCNCKLASFSPINGFCGSPNASCAINSTGNSVAPVKQEQIVYTKETFYSSFDPNQADVPRFELTETEKFMLSLSLSLIGRERNHILTNRLDASEIHQHFINPNLMRDFDDFVGHAYEVYQYLNSDCDLQLLVKGASELSGGAASDLSPICSSSDPLHDGDDDEFGVEPETAADTYDLLKDYFIISPTSYNITSLGDSNIRNTCNS